ncbi:MAG: beta-lactamase family protein [Marinilabiliales bacterium]|nr:beta-lactamase family protein [Marinilabiliales bacterium]
MFKSIAGICLLWILSLGVQAQENGKSWSIPTLTSLKDSIGQVMKESNAAGAGIVILSGDSTLWMGGMGMADRESGRLADENTLFRLGSLSKTMVSLALLKLQEEGKLSLKDKISDLIPEIRFDNPWEKTHPVRVEHLLEHTSGWSYWHMAELGFDDPQTASLREALDFYPKSRKSSHIPGTRINESNVGTAVAAYIVEKVTGMRFEDYMESTFFRPLGMESTAFVETAEYKKKGATLYENGVRLNYFHMLYRPAAAIHSSPKDFARIVRLFLQRGTVQGVRLLSDSSISRMERSESMGQLSGLAFFKGCGLSDYATSFRGFDYHGFGGSLPGGNALMGYLPEHQVGYAVMINDGSEEVANRIAGLILRFQTTGLNPAKEKQDTLPTEITFDPSGYYTNVEPKIDLIRFHERIKNIQRVWVKNDTLYSKYPLRGHSTLKYVAADHRQFRNAGTNRIGMVFVDDPLEGTLMVTHDFFKKISPVTAIGLLTLFYAFLIQLFALPILGFLWLLSHLIRNRKNMIFLKMGLWTMLPEFCFWLVYAIIVTHSGTRYDWFQLFGTANVWSILLLLLGVGFALASVWSFFTLIRNRKAGMNGFFYGYFFLTSLLNLLFTLYFLGNGLIGIPTWV